jgi:hypothetical protein
MKDEAQIHIDLSNYTAGTHWVEYSNSEGYVSIVNKDTGESDVYLDGRDALEFIKEAERIYNKVGTIGMDVATQSVAKRYIDSL